MKRSKFKSLSNMQICLTGFNDPEIVIIKARIEEAGGIYTENLSKKTNYLISDKINTKKSLAAQDQKIKIVTKEWIWDENDDKYLNVKKTTIKCFHNLPVFVFGFDESSPEYLAIISRIQSNNGKLVYSTTEADVIVFKKGLFFTEKELIEIDKFKDRIVIEDWVDECIQSKRFVDLDQARFRLKNEILHNKFNALEQTILSTEDGRSELFLKCIFYISNDFDIETKLVLNRAISLGSGLVYNKITALTTHIICSSNYDDYKGETEDFGSNSFTNRITVNWIFDSLENDTLRPYEEYRPVEAFSMNCDPNDQREKRRYRQLIVSNIFIHETFTIYKGTYTAEEYQLIREKIIENNGEVIDGSTDDFMKNISAKYIIINDGYGILLNQLLGIVDSLQSTHFVISHRFVDTCIEKRKIVEFSDFLTLFPFAFKVPHQQMAKNGIQIYVPNTYYSFCEKNSYEILIETLGGRVDLTPQTTHVIVNKEIKKSDVIKIKKRSHQKVNIVNDEWLIDLILNGSLQPEENYLPKIIE